MADPKKAYLAHDITPINYNLKHLCKTAPTLPPQNEDD